VSNDILCQCGNFSSGTYYEQVYMHYYPNLHLVYTLPRTPHALHGC
jgi:hypothetical protein